MLHGFGSRKLLSSNVKFISVGVLTHAPKVSGSEMRGSSKNKENSQLVYFVYLLYLLFIYYIYLHTVKILQVILRLKILI